MKKSINYKLKKLVKTIETIQKKWIKKYKV